MKKKLHELTKEEYEALYRSGMMGEFYPDASGCYEKDVEEYNEQRMNIIGLNGPTGEHYNINELDGFNLGTYQRAVKDKVIDIYDILELYKVYNPATAHAIKKLLMPGQRGNKGVIQDLEEAKQSITRAIELEKSYHDAD